MPRGFGIRLAAVSLALTITATAQTKPAPTASKAVLLELFTSEGCSSCPPADRLLQRMSGALTGTGARLIVLSEHVTYWDHLGWRDPFSSSGVTDRQNAYGNRFHLSSVYTPQLVVNGRAEVVGSDLRAIQKAVDSQASAPAATLQIRSIQTLQQGLQIDLAFDGMQGQKTDLYVVVAQDEASTRVGRGENAGTTMNHVNVVRSLSRVATLHGESSLTIQLPAEHLVSSRGEKRHLVVFAQEQGLGSVLASASASF